MVCVCTEQGNGGGEEREEEEREKGKSKKGKGRKRKGKKAYAVARRGVVGMKRKRGRSFVKTPSAPQPTLRSNPSAVFRCDCWD